MVLLNQLWVHHYFTVIAATGNFQVFDLYQTLTFENGTKTKGVLTFFQQLVAQAYTTVENILAQTFYPLVLTLTQSLSVVAQ